MASSVNHIQVILTFELNNVLLTAIDKSHTALNKNTWETELTST